VAAFLGYFISRPLQALEENLQFITWLGIIYNSYWTTLTQAQDPAAYLDDVKQATDDAIARIKELMDKHTERSGARPNVRG
jgi:glutathione S-transferase